jgi:hypothetical protein
VKGCEKQGKEQGKVCDCGGGDGGEGRLMVDELVGEVELVSDEEGKLLVEEFQCVQKMQ